MSNRLYRVVFTAFYLTVALSSATVQNRNKYKCMSYALNKPQCKVNATAIVSQGCNWYECYYTPSNLSFPQSLELY